MPLPRQPCTVLQPLAAHLRPLDDYFARFIQRKSATDCPILGLLAALTSYWFGQGHVCLPLGRAAPLYQQLAQEQAREDILTTLQSAQLAASLQQYTTIGTASSAARPLILDGVCLYLYKCWRDECHVAAFFLQDRAQLTVEARRIRPTLDRLFAPSDAPIDEQKIACALAAMQPVAVITGGPGTGKTTTVAKLLAVLVEACGMSPSRIALSAPTGKAAARLRVALQQAIAHLPCEEAIKQSLPTDVVTVHRLLGARADRASFAYHQTNKLHCDVLIIDEASMVDLSMMTGVLHALPADARLVLLGDAQQLASVNAGSVLADICGGGIAYDALTRTRLVQATGCAESALPVAQKNGSLLQYRAHLRHQWRFAGQSPIGQLAHGITEGDAPRAEQVLQSFPEALSWQSETAIDGIIQQAADHYQPLLDAIVAQSPITDHQAIRRLLKQCTHYQLLSVVRSGAYGVVGLNRAIAAKLLGVTMPAPWYAGRFVIVTRNLFHLKLVNGDTGLTLADAKGRLWVWFIGEDDIPRAFSPSQLTDCESAYAITVHRSQGSEFGHVGLVLPQEDHALLSRELLYTAVTRAKDKVTLYGSQAVLRSAIARRLTRDSGLLERLHGPSGPAQDEGQ